MVWNQTRLAVVDEGREIDTIIPIGCEVGDAFVGEGSGYPSKKNLLGCLFLQLCLGAFLLALCLGFSCGGSSDLVVENESPYQTQDELLVVPSDVPWTCECVYSKCIYIFACVESVLGVPCECVYSKCVCICACVESVLGVIWAVAAEDTSGYDECVCNHVGSRGVWEHFLLENFSQFKALRLLLRSVSSQNSSTACSLIFCAVFCNQTRPPR